MADPNTLADNSIWVALVNKILDWPVLLFVLCLIIMFRSGKAVLELFKGRKIEVDVGGNKLSIGDAVQALDDQSISDFKKLQQEIAPLELRVEALEAHAKLPIGRKRLTGLPGLGGANFEFQQLDSAGGNRDAEGSAAKIAPAANERGQAWRNEVFKRMFGELTDTRFTWRTIERLAAVAAVSEDQARDILAAHPNEVVFGKSRDGKALVRLAGRESN